MSRNNSFSDPTPDRDFLSHIFQKVDKDRNGSISAYELQQALGNGTHTPFNPNTIRILISNLLEGMFDKSNKLEITFDDFCHLWRYVVEWQNCFRKFDHDNSGCIDKNEFRQALIAFNYRISDKIVDLFVKKFDRQGKGSLAFDDFIQACVALENFTSAFRTYDFHQTGAITIQYEEFLSLIINLKHFF